MPYGDFKDLNRRTAADKTFHIAKIQNMMDINVDWLQWSIYLYKSVY